jgi:hypothetical protein
MLTVAICYEQIRFDSVEDQCYVQRYTSCVNKDGVLVPTTFDPKIRREMNRMVYYVNKERKKK